MSEKKHQKEQFQIYWLWKWTQTPIISRFMCVYKSRVHTYYGVKVFWDKKYGCDLVMLKKVNIKIDLVNADNSNQGSTEQHVASRFQCVAN